MEEAEVFSGSTGSTSVNNTLIGYAPIGSAIHFQTSNREYPEMLKLCENGDIFVKGKLVENDIEVVDAMREFLGSQGYLNK